MYFLVSYIISFDEKVFDTVLMNISFRCSKIDYVSKIGNHLSFHKLTKRLMNYSMTLLSSFIYTQYRLQTLFIAQCLMSTIWLSDIKSHKIRSSITSKNVSLSCHIKLIYCVCIWLVRQQWMFHKKFYTLIIVFVQTETMNSTNGW